MSKSRGSQSSFSELCESRKPCMKMRQKFRMKESYLIILLLLSRDPNSLNRVNHVNHVCKPCEPPNFVWLALEGPSCVVESIFSIQLPTLFHHHYFHWEKRALLRSCETWPRLNSCSRSVQPKGTPTGAYLAHPSIKAGAKVGK
jgi:hypothetical protein